jgi:hypothetical protein
MVENESNEILKTVGDSITSNNSSDVQTNQTLYIKQSDIVELHWKINRKDDGALEITFDKTCLPDDIVYGDIYNPKIIYNRNYVSSYRITQCAFVSDNIGGVAFTINGGENGKWFTNYNVIIDKSKFIKTNLLLTVNDVRKEYNTSDNNTTYRITAPFTRNQNISLPVSSPDDDIDFNVVYNFTINILNADKNKIKILSGDLYISVNLSYYIKLNIENDDDLDDEDETLPSISGNFFSPGEVLYYIEGNYIKKIVVYEIELTWEKPADVDIMEQTSLTDIHGRRGIGEKKYIDDYKLFIDKDNLINHVTNNEERKEPEKKYFYVKYRLGDSVYSLWNGSVRYAKIIKVIYTESKSLVDYTTKIDIKYTLQEGEDEWIVSEDNVFADKSDIKTTISDELSVEDYSNNLIYLGCDVCDVKK